MDDLEFELRLQQIADLAKAEKEGGPFSVQADAMMALDLVEKLARLLIEQSEVKRL